MYCQRCQNDLPDGAEACPVCGAVTRRGAMKHNRPQKRCVFTLDMLSMLTALIHALIWGTGSHYLGRAVDNMFWERQLRYELHPALIAVDIVFAVLFIAIPVFSAIMRYNLMRMRRIGRVYLTVTLVLSLLWGILYPLMTYAATGIPSPIMGFCIGQAVVYAALAATPATVVFTSDKFTN